MGQMTAPPVLDPVALERLRRIGGDALERQMLALFREAAPRHVVEVRAAAAAGDLAALARAAHALVSNAGNVGGSEVVACARSLEAAAAARRSAEVPALTAALDAAFGRLEAGLAAAGKALG